jgi:hypothetical protein
MSSHAGITSNTWTTERSSGELAGLGSDVAAGSGLQAGERTLVSREPGPAWVPAADRLGAGFVAEAERVPALLVPRRVAARRVAERFVVVVERAARPAVSVGAAAGAGAGPAAVVAAAAVVATAALTAEVAGAATVVAAPATASTAGTPVAGAAAMRLAASAAIFFTWPGGTLSACFAGAGAGASACFTGAGWSACLTGARAT